MAFHITQKEQSKVLPDFDESLLFSLDRRYFDFLDLNRLSLCSGKPDEFSFNHAADLRFLKIAEVNYSEDRHSGLHLINFQNVLAALNHPSHNVLNVIKSDGNHISLYYGISRNINDQKSIFQVQTHEYAAILEDVLRGNFHGSTFKKLDAAEIHQEITGPMIGMDIVCAFPGIPSLREKAFMSDSEYSQGVERFLDAMRGEEFILAVIAEPIGLPVIDSMITNLFDLGADVHSKVKATVTKTKGSSDTINMGLFGARGMNQSISESLGQSSTEATTQGKSLIGNAGAVQGLSTAVGALVGSIVPGVGTFLGGYLGSGIGSIAGWGMGRKAGSPVATTEAFTSSNSFMRGVANTTGNMMAGGGYGGYGRSWQRSMAVSSEILNKKAEHCENLCNKYISRLEGGKNLGLWNVGIYLLTPDNYTSIRASGMLKAMLSGDETHWEPIRSLQLPHLAKDMYLTRYNNPEFNLLRYGEEREKYNEYVDAGAKLQEYAKKTGVALKELCEKIFKKPESLSDIVQEIQSKPQADDTLKNKAWAALKDACLGHPLGRMMGGVATPLNTEELSIVMNVPRREVPGITVRDIAQFGVHCPSPEKSDDDTFMLGNIIHKSMPDTRLPFHISRDELTKHGLICGMTGSGKTNTVMQFLTNSTVPFLVIEPAKTEYRHLIGREENLKVFTLGDETISRFRLNPFSFAKGSGLLTHINQLRAVFNAAFPMYASMPYILEEAIMSIYKDHGWELATSKNKYIDVDEESVEPYLPTLEDLVVKIEQVVKDKSYSGQLSSDITAALKARLGSLTNGGKGLMLNTRCSTPLEELLEQRVVFELASIGDDDEKAFIMGLILMKIYQIREKQGSSNGQLKHLTVIEEAHRLIRRTSEIDSMESVNLRGKAVETFSNIMSEVREYGEGLLIVDQVPSRLAADAIKNTGMKIVHRLPARDDGEIMASAMGVNAHQQKEFTKLQVGRAVISKINQDQPFMLLVKLIKDNNKHISNGRLAQHMSTYHESMKHVYVRYPGFDKSGEIENLFNSIDFRVFEPEMYARVLAFCGLSMIGCHEESRQLQRKSVVKTASLLFNTEAELEHDCVFIWYLNLFISNVNAYYKNVYGKTLKAHKLLIDTWFADEPLSYDSLEELRKTMSSMSRGSHLDPVIRWFVEHNNYREMVLRALNKVPPKIDEIGKILAVFRNEIFPNIPLQKATFQVFDEVFLTICLERTPYSQIDFTKLCDNTNDSN